MISSLNRFNNLTQRIIAALIGVAIIISCIVAGHWFYFGIFFLLCMLAQLEFYKLAGMDGLLPLKFWGTFVGLGIYTITFLVEAGVVGHQAYYYIFPLAASIYFVKLYNKEDKKPFTNIAFTFLGIIYVAVPFALLHLAVYSKGGYSYQVILGSLLILWASDTGAYFAGTKFGKTKLFERVSPKKSWEGSVGGTLLALAMAYGISYYFQDVTRGEWLVMAGIIVIAGTYGDLLESLFKRSIAIKDSGSVIPGHGGFLDRFDGLLLAAPFISTFLMLF